MSPRRITGSEADRDHRDRGYPIVSAVKSRRPPRRSWFALIGAAMAGFVSLYLGKSE